MKKGEFIEKYVEATGLPKKQVVEIVGKFWEIVVAAVKKGDEVPFDFGKFVLKSKPARPAKDGINPATGEKIRIAAKPATVVPQFKPNKNFKEAVLPASKKK